MVLQFVNEIRQEDIRILCQPTDRSKISKAYLNLSLKQGCIYSSRRRKDHVRVTFPEGCGTPDNLMALAYNPRSIG